MDMTGGFGNGVRTESQGGLLVREVDQAVAPVEDLDLGSEEPARDRAAGPAGSDAAPGAEPGSDSEAVPTAEPAAGADAGPAGPDSDQLPPLRRPLRVRVRDRMRNLFGTRRQIVDDLLECAPVGPYARMAEEVLEQEQPRHPASVRRPTFTR